MSGPSDPEERPDTGSEPSEWLAVGPTTVEVTEADERPPADPTPKLGRRFGFRRPRIARPPEAAETAESEQEPITAASAELVAEPLVAPPESQPEPEPEVETEPAEESPSPPAGTRRAGQPDRRPGRRPPPRLVARVAELERRLSQMETDRRGQLAQLRAELDGLRRDRDADQELIGVLTERFRARPRQAAGEPLDLNEASFEQLRELGISVTQASRVIAAREAAGGFGSLDELDALPGFSPAQLESLKAATQT